MRSRLPGPVRSSTALSVAAVLVAGILPPALVQARAPDDSSERPWILGGPRGAFEGPIVSERPSFSTSPDATPPGRVNAELGVELGRDDRGGGDLESVTFPFALARLGILPRLELRAGWGGLGETRLDGEESDSLADPSVGFKWQLNDGSAWVPRTGLVVDVGLPVGEDTGSDETTVTAGLAWTHGLGDRLGLFGTSTLGRSARGNDAFLESTHAVGLGLALTSRFGTWAEYSATVDEDAVDSHTLDAGLTFLVTEDLQLDAYGGVGLDDGARDGFLGAGAAWRF